MPDLERVLRSLEKHCAPDDQSRAIVSARHHGEDGARWQIAAATLVAALISTIASLLDAGAFQ